MKKELIILIGPPLSGKDTYIKNNNLTDHYIISRDDILISMYPDINYSSAFFSADQKKVNKMVNSEIEKAIDSEKNVIINMTNLTKKSRNKQMSKFPNKYYYKTAVVFPRLSDEEYKIRNEKRKEVENKYISPTILKEMINNWEDLTNEEGFDKIIKL